MSAVEKTSKNFQNSNSSRPTKTHTKVADDWALSGKIGTITRRQYENTKRRVMEFERKNNGSILVLPRSGSTDWCEMCETSALFYKYVICNKVNAKVNLENDINSFFSQYEIGKVATRGFSTIRRRIKQAGLFGKERHDDSTRCVIFDLNQKFTAKEIKEFAEREKTAQREANNIIKVEVADPTLYRLIAELCIRLHQVCAHKFDKFTRDTNGKRIVGIGDNLLRQYYHFANTGKCPPGESIVAWQKLSEANQSLLLEIQICVNLILLKKQLGTALAEQIIQIEGRINEHIRNETKRLEKTNRGNGSKRPAPVAT